MIANHGGDDARSEQLAKAKNSALVARRNLDIVEDSLAKLNPDNANLLKNRLAASLTNNSARLEAANARINQAKGILMGMGQEDPEETAAIARANLDRAQEEFDRHSKRAKALKLIEELIQTERSNINNAQSVPLTSRMEPYLRTVFGPETNVAVRWNDNNEFDHIAIERNSRGEGALPFAALSGGAREQAGVALRLALAELINQKSGQDQSVFWMIRLPIQTPTVSANCKPCFILARKGDCRLWCSHAIPPITQPWAEPDTIWLLPPLCAVVVKTDQAKY